MHRRESSLIFKPFNSLESNLSIQSSTNKQQALPPIGKIPEWLIDYDSQQAGGNSNVEIGDEGKISKSSDDKPPRNSEIYRVRPLTENLGQSRPLWFQELLRSRRHSEVLLSSSAFEEEDMSYRLSSIEMENENSVGSSSDNVDIIMILDDEHDDGVEDDSLPSSNESGSGSGSGEKRIKDFHQISPSKISSRRRCSLQLIPRKEGRSHRSFSQFFECDDFKSASKENQMSNSNGINRSSKSMLLLNAEELNNKCNESLLLTALNGLETAVNERYIDDDADDERTVFRRKDLNHRDSYTAADIDLVNLDESDLETDFIIPELPEGRELTIEIKTNWGDEDYVGFNGIEIFDLKTKSQTTIEKISCDSVNKGKNDLRKLIDGVYRTHNDDHIWMTDYSPLNCTRLTIKFQEKISIVLIRFWNYNKSRIYSYRGIRYITITLDDVVIFKGEIAKAIGELNGPPERFGDTILFTTDETILEEVAINDTSFQELLNQNV